LRILFSVRNPAYVRYYDSVLRALAARGHTIDLVTQAGKRTWPPSTLELADQNPGIRLSALPDVRLEPWWELGSRLRQARFYLRFLRPEYRHTPELLARARSRAPYMVVWVAERIRGAALARGILVRIIDMLEESTRGAARFHEYLSDRNPDIVVTTPLVILKTAQMDLHRAAAQLGVRNVFAVASWDHLSSKGELTFAPQRVFVWNEIQQREAETLHRIDPSRVTTTGAPVFDDWFGRTASTQRAEFCQRVGLRSDRPFILYVCSSLLEGSPTEAPFVMRWVRHLRHSTHAALRDCGILIRPHPHRGREWRGIDFTGIDNVVCWPSSGEMPADEAAKTDYFHSLYHGAATVGLNTSAMIEAAILGRCVHTILLPEFEHSQEGTLHFRYLLDIPERFLRVTRSLDDHARELARDIEGLEPKAVDNAPFLRKFIRPSGIDIRATDQFVSAIEQVATEPAPRPLAVPRWTFLVRPFLWPFAQAAARRARRVDLAFREQKANRLADHRRQKAATAKHEQATP
jgi:hypothetical protein